MEVGRGRKSTHGLGKLFWRSSVVVLIRTNVMAVVLGSPQDSTNSGVSKGPGGNTGISAYLGLNQPQNDLSLLE